MMRLSRPAQIRLGIAFWLGGTIEYFTTQIIGQLAWTTPYSWSNMNISDLGAARCGLTTTTPVHYLCSPLHGIVNAGFILQGICIMAGLVLMRRTLFGGKLGTVAFGLLMIHGLGYVLVGLAPEDTQATAHVASTLIGLLCATIGLMVAGPSLVNSFPRWLRLTTSTIGMISFTALWLFIGGIYVGLGMGGIERVAVYGSTAWILIMCIAIDARLRREDT